MKPDFVESTAIRGSYYSRARTGRIVNYYKWGLWKGKIVGGVCEVVGYLSTQRKSVAVFQTLHNSRASSVASDLRKYTPLCNFQFYMFRNKMLRSEYILVKSHGHLRIFVSMRNFRVRLNLLQYNNLLRLPPIPLLLSSCYTEHARRASHATLHTNSPEMLLALPPKYRSSSKMRRQGEKNT